MKKYLFIAAFFLLCIIQAKAQYVQGMGSNTSDSYSAGSFNLTWYLDGDILHYTVSGDTGSVFTPSSDPTGRDNSVWFQCWDTAQNQYIHNFEVIWFQNTFPYGYFTYSGQVDLTGYDHNDIDLYSGLSVW